MNFGDYCMGIHSQLSLKTRQLAMAKQEPDDTH